MKTYYGITRISHLFDIIDDVCEALKGPSENVESTKALIISTIAQETLLGTLKDPTKYKYGTGITQLDPIGLVDIQKRAGKWFGTCKKAFGFDISKVEHTELEEAPVLSVVMTRLKYKLVPYKIPEDPEGQWRYYKQWYNSYAGAATREEYMKNREWSLNLYQKWRSGVKI
jgi:hypothetical protein